MGFVSAEEGAWVRVKIGPYSGDLGKVVSVDYNSDSARVKVVPPPYYPVRFLFISEARCLH